ncbi:MAG: RNA methyltransferase [Bacteroidota bacterium]
MRKRKNEELARLDVAGFKNAPKTPLVLVLDNIRSLNNIGSVFRTADAFLVQKVFLCGITATPPHKDIHKTALGATESVDWEYGERTEDIVLRLRSEGFIVLALEQAEKAVMLQDFALKGSKPYALVLGNEVKGVAQEVVDLCDRALEIPQYGTKHSLNIAVSAGIAIWDLWTKLRSKPG